MLYIMRHEDYPGDDIAAKAAGKPYLTFPDTWFNVKSRGFNLSADPWFNRILEEVDVCDIPFPDVARDLVTGKTHSFDKVSTGVRTLWLMYHFPNDWLYPSQWLGENCYQAMFDASKDKDIVVFNDSNMLMRRCEGYCMDSCSGTFKDFKRGICYTAVPGGTVCKDFACTIFEDECLEDDL